MLPTSLTSQESMSATDCIVVGASFAGLACAHSAAARGLDVVVVEKKSDPGAKLHTTGIIVKDVLDSVALLDDVPSQLIRKISGVRLYAPNMRSVDLHHPDYYFLATDTPNLIRWLAEKARSAGARVQLARTFTGVSRQQSGFDVHGIGQTRYLIGADGPSSNVAKSLQLGTVRDTLFGIEHEYDRVEINDPGFLHCFIDRKLAPGYIGWVLQGVKGAQVGLARRVRTSTSDVRPAMSAFLTKISTLFPAVLSTPSSIRAGHIPCGGVVRPACADRTILVGDAAGMVSPVTAGGIHTALQHGQAVGHAVADFLTGRSGDPAATISATYPRYRTKRLLRRLYDVMPYDLAFNLLLRTKVVRDAASVVYFHAR